MFIKMPADEILKFCFEELTAEQRFAKESHVDQMILRRFRRFPHRNAVLGRVSTPEELAFLQSPGSSF